MYAGYLQAADPLDVRAYLSEKEFLVSKHEWLEKLWQSFALVSALLIGSSVQPFVQFPNNLDSDFWDGPGFQLYGLAWALTLGMNCISLLASIIGLGYLLTWPKTLTYHFVHEAGFLVVMPAVLVMAGAVSFGLASVYTTFCIYGVASGAPYACVALIAIAFGIWVAVRSCIVRPKLCWCKPCKIRNVFGKDDGLCLHAHGDDKMCDSQGSRTITVTDTAHAHSDVGRCDKGTCLPHACLSGFGMETATASENGTNSFHGPPSQLCRCSTTC